MAPLRVTRAVLPALRRSARPRIVTISSIMGSMQREGSINYAYCSSKSAANKVARLLAQELRPDGIVAVPVHPGWVRTDMGGDAGEPSLTCQILAEPSRAPLVRLARASQPRCL